MSDYTGILNTQTAAEIFGEDARPFYPERAETFCASIASCNGAVIVGLQSEIDKLRAELDAATKRADELQKAFDALHKMHEGAFSDARHMATHWDYGDNHLFDCSILDNGICNCDSAIAKKYANGAK